MAFSKHHRNNLAGKTKICTSPYSNRPFLKIGAEAFPDAGEEQPVADLGVLSTISGVAGRPWRCEGKQRPILLCFCAWETPHQRPS